RDALRHQACRDIHAVEDVADIVQHVGGYFGHAGLPGRVEQLLVYLLEFLCGEAPLGDVLDPRHGTECLSGRADEPPRARERSAHGTRRRDDDKLDVADVVTAQRTRQWTGLARYRRSAIRPINLGPDGVGVAGEGGRVLRGNSKELDRRAVVVRNPSG